MFLILVCCPGVLVITILYMSQLKNHSATNHKTITYRKYNELDIHSMGINMIQKLSHITSNNNADVEKTTNS